MGFVCRGMHTPGEFTMKYGNLSVVGSSGRSAQASKIDMGIFFKWLDLQGYHLEAAPAPFTNGMVLVHYHPFSFQLHFSTRPALSAPVHGRVLNALLLGFLGSGRL